MERRQSLGFFCSFFFSAQHTTDDVSLQDGKPKVSRRLSLLLIKSIGAWRPTSAGQTAESSGQDGNAPPPRDCSRLKALSDVNDCVTAAQGFLSENRKSALMVCECVRTDCSVEGCCR